MIIQIAIEQASDDKESYVWALSDDGRIFYSPADDPTEWSEVDAPDDEEFDEDDE